MRDERIEGRIELVLPEVYRILALKHVSVPACAAADFPSPMTSNPSSKLDIGRDAHGTPGFESSKLPSGF